MYDCLSVSLAACLRVGARVLVYERQRGQSAANVYEKWVVFFVMSLMDNVHVCVLANAGGGNSV